MVRGSSLTARIVGRRPMVSPVWHVLRGLNGSHAFPARRAQRNVAGYNNVYRADALDNFNGGGQVRIRH